MSPDEHEAGPQCAPRPSWALLPALAWLSVSSTLSGCATTAGRFDAPLPSPRTRVLLASPEACCGAVGASTVQALTEALARHGQVQRVQVPAPRPPAPRPTDPPDRLDPVLRRARQDYLAMRMEEAKARLTRALSRAGCTAARGTSPRSLASLHLLLCAVSDAQHQTEQVRRHCDAAVSFDPELVPDPEIFPPPVSEAVQQARARVERVNVVVRTAPPGGVVHWDGQRLGPAPARLPDQVRGQHYLLVEHPLYRPRQEVIHLSTSAELEVELEPADPPDIIVAAAQQPSSRPQAAQLLGVDSLIWMTTAADGSLSLECAGADGASRRLALAADSPTLLVERAAADCARRGDGVSAGAPATQRAAAAAEASSGAASSDRAEAVHGGTGHFRRYWWVWAGVGAVALSAGIALPLLLDADAQPGRPVRLELPLRGP